MPPLGALLSPRTSRINEVLPPRGVSIRRRLRDAFECAPSHSPRSPEPEQAATRCRMPGIGLDKYDSPPIDPRHCPSGMTSAKSALHLYGRTGFVPLNDVLKSFAILPLVATTNPNSELFHCSTAKVGTIRRIDPSSEFVREHRRSRKR